jgi:TIR domain/Pentapeptide repeats (8 copies)
MVAYSGAMANPEHLAILKSGVVAWNEWRSSHLLQEMDLRDAKLDGAELARADLTVTDLRNAELMGANLHEADLREAHIWDADLRDANLRNARLHRTDLRRANLTGASLHRADLHQTVLTRARLDRSFLYDAHLVGVHLEEAKFRDAYLGSTIFGTLDLSSADGLESMVHSGPSVLGMDTYMLSKGKLPEAFLRGVGWPDTLIRYARSLLTNPIEFYSCFISYAGSDQDFANRLHADLQVNGVRCWFAPDHVRGGKKLHEQIDEAIKVYDRLLLILSEHSMNSEWVKTEIANARQREIREKRQMLFPISLVPYEKITDWQAFDADTGKDSAREIREYFIPDFPNWKDHDSYQQAFQRLLRDLKAERGIGGSGR